jgi:hypothetical protein
VSCRRLPEHPRSSHGPLDHSTRSAILGHVWLCIASGQGSGCGAEPTRPRRPPAFFAHRRTDAGLRSQVTSSHRTDRLFATPVLLSHTSATRRPLACEVHSLGSCGSEIRISRAGEVSTGRFGSRPMQEPGDCQAASGTRYRTSPAARRWHRAMPTPPAHLPRPSNDITHRRYPNCA